MKRSFGLLLNASRWGVEFYEENLCWLLPCYEVELFASSPMTLLDVGLSQDNVNFGLLHSGVATGAG